MSSAKPLFSTPVAIVIAGAVIGASIYFSQNPPALLDSGQTEGAQTTGDTQPKAPTAIPQPVDVSVEGEPFLGQDNAPVTMVEFTDFQCPFCKRFFDQTFAPLKKNYIDTGKVKYVVRDFPLGIHPNANAAANAANCAFNQADNKSYFNYHDLLFKSQTAWADLSNPGDQFKSYADEIGLDPKQFSNCYDNEEYADEIRQDLTDGQTAGVRGTPAFYINGKPLSGAQPYARFEQMIKAELQ